MRRRLLKYWSTIITLAGAHGDLLALVQHAKSPTGPGSPAPATVSAGTDAVAHRLAIQPVGRDVQPEILRFDPAGRPGSSRD